MEITKPRSEMEHIIDEWIFNERDRSILKRRFLDGITYERIAEEFELSTQQIKTIVNKCQAILVCHLR